MMDRYDIAALCREYAQECIYKIFEVQYRTNCSDAEAVNRAVNLIMAEILDKTGDKLQAVPYETLRKTMVLILKLGTARECKNQNDSKFNRYNCRYKNWLESITFGEQWQKPRLEDVVFYMD